MSAETSFSQLGMYARRETSACPSTNSDDFRERLFARKTRMEKRQAKIAAKEHGEEVLVDEKDTSSYKQHQTRQFEESYQLLRQMEMEGARIATNVQVATEARNQAYRLEKVNEDKESQEKVESDLKNFLERAEELAQKWKVFNNLEFAHKFQEFHNSFIGFIDPILEEKDRTIAETEGELKRKEKIFTDTLVQQATEVAIMLDRMTSSYNTLYRGYQQELLNQEDAFLRDRKQMITEHYIVFEKRMKHRREIENRYLVHREKTLDHYQNEMAEMRSQNSEELTLIISTLSSDTAVLQAQLQNMKAAYLTNKEKLEYNYQILRKREDESAVTRNLQKRKLTRLHDVLCRLREKYKRTQRVQEVENKAIVREHTRYRNYLIELSSKTFITGKSVALKFDDIWYCNEEDCKEILSKILETDKVIQENILGLPWLEPNFPFTKNLGPIDVDKLYSETNVALEKKVPESGAQGGMKLDGASTELTSNEGEQHSGSTWFEAPVQIQSYGALRLLLKLICKEAPFLLHPRLERIMESLSEEDKLLIRADTFLKTLDVSYEDELHILAQYFEDYVENIEQKLLEVPAKYVQVGKEDVWILTKMSSESLQSQLPRNVATAASRSASSVDSSHDLALGGKTVKGAEQMDSISPTPRSGPSGRSDDEPTDRSSSRSGDHRSASSGMSGKKKALGKTDRATDHVESVGDASDEEEDHFALALSQEELEDMAQFVEDTVLSTKALPMGLQDRVLGEAHPNDVVKVLRKFLEDRKNNPATARKIYSFKKSKRRKKNRDTSRDLWYWTQYSKAANFMGRHWEVLEKYLGKMYANMKDRQMLIDENNALYQSNVELRHLLRAYLSAHENKLLVNPPLQTMIGSFRTLPLPTVPQIKKVSANRASFLPAINAHAPVSSRPPAAEGNHAIAEHAIQQELSTGIAITATKLPPIQPNPAVGT